MVWVEKKHKKIDRRLSELGYSDSTHWTRFFSQYIYFLFFIFSLVSFYFFISWFLFSLGKCHFDSCGRLWCQTSLGKYLSKSGETFKIMSKCARCFFVLPGWTLEFRDYEKKRGGFTLSRYNFNGKNILCAFKIPIKNFIYFYFHKEIIILYIL